MSDTYLDLVSSGWGRTVAGKLGLPQPVELRRTDPDSVDRPLVPGPVLVLDGGTSVRAADTVAEALLGWELDVRRDPEELAKGRRWGAVVVVLTDIASPAHIGAPALALGGALRRLAPGGRVVTLSRRAEDATDPTVAAARLGVDGFLRSLAKELRAGATGNGLVLADDLPVDAPAALGALRFFLSARSAFVSRSEERRVGTGCRSSWPRYPAPASWATSARAPTGV